MVLPRKLFLVETRRKSYFVRADDVDWIEAAGNYLRLHTDGKVHVFRGTMSRAETELEPDQFMRVHRSAIVNVDSVVEIRKLPSGDGCAVLNNGAEIRISRRYWKRVRNQTGPRKT